MGEAELAYRLLCRKKPLPRLQVGGAGSQNGDPRQQNAPVAKPRL